MAEKFVIKGGKPLSGTVEIRGSKNSCLSVLAASLLTKEPCQIDNIPLIEDVLKMIKVLEGLGAKVTWLAERKIEIVCGKIDPEKLPSDIISHFRGSVLVLGPLLARFGKMRFPVPGGCLIGARPIDAHLDAFLQLGIENNFDGKYFNLKSNRKVMGSGSWGSVILREFSVTATENVLLLSSLFEGRTSLKIADVDYQVQELAKVLEKMGAKINFKGVREFEIVGSRELRGFSHFVMYDPIEAGTFIVASLATQGEVLVKNAELSFLDLFLKRLADFGAKFEIRGDNEIKVLASGQLKMDKVQSLPYPGMQTDLQPELGVLATQSKGPTLIHDPLYEGRLKYLESLNKMGADIIFCDPHRAVINGPTILRGIEIPSLDIRGGAALIVAGLVAQGQTTINNIYQIDRGYEKIEVRLQKLGADIKRIND